MLYVRRGETLRSKLVRSMAVVFLPPSLCNMLLTSIRTTLRFLKLHWLLNLAWSLFLYIIMGNWHCTKPYNGIVFLGYRWWAGSTGILTFNLLTVLLLRTVMLIMLMMVLLMLLPLLLLLLLFLLKSWWQTLIIWS